MAGLRHLFEAIFGDRIQMLTRLAREHPRIGRARFGRLQVVLVNSPELVFDVLVDKADDYQKGPALRVISRPLLGDGLLTSEGERHRERRKLLAPAFAHQRVSKYVQVMTDRTSAAISKWRSGQQVDMALEMMRLTLDIVGRTLFDVDLLGDADSLGRDITKVQHAAILQMRVPFRIPFRKKSRAALDRLNATIYSMVRERRAAGKDRGDLLSMLLLARNEDTGQYLTDQEVRDEAMTLFVAGHETTAQAMAWSWYLLAKERQHLERLRSEGARFALQVMKEAMRLYPPAMLIARSPLRSTTIGNFRVEQDDIVMISPWLFHRDPRLFADPLRFDPDRFLPEREAAIPRFAYMPFGGGRRICIGNQFAMMEGQIILSRIAPAFDMELLSTRPVKPQPLLTLRPNGGIPVRLHAVVKSATEKSSEIV